MKVYVISNEDHPLMPCEPVIARLLLKSKRAKVIRREPLDEQCKSLPVKDTRR